MCDRRRGFSCVVAVFTFIIFREINQQFSGRAGEIVLHNRTRESLCSEWTYHQKAICQNKDVAVSPSYVFLMYSPKETRRRSRFLATTLCVTNRACFKHTFPTNRFCSVSGRDMSGNLRPTKRGFFRNSCMCASVKEPSIRYCCDRASRETREEGRGAVNEYKAGWYLLFHQCLVNKTNGNAWYY